MGPIVIHAQVEQILGASVGSLARLRDMASKIVLLAAVVSCVSAITQAPGVSFAQSPPSVSDSAAEIVIPKVRNITRLKYEQIYFVTNRVIMAPNGAGGQDMKGRLINFDDTFSNTLDANLKIGEAGVEFPADRDLAEQTYAHNPGGENPLQNFTITSFADQLASWLLPSHGSKSLLIYVHGFNTDFDGSIAEAAQLSDDLHFGGSLIVFCWPSDVGWYQYFEGAAARRFHLLNYHRFWSNYTILY
jgi:Alpha/beta hydrolase of unknown function (DUF900)